MRPTQPILPDPATIPYPARAWADYWYSQYQRERANYRRLLWTTAVLFVLCGLALAAIITWTLSGGKELRCSHGQVLQVREGD